MLDRYFQQKAAAQKAALAREALNNEVGAVMDSLGRTGQPYRTSHRVAKELLMRNTMVWEGRLFQFKVKHVGLGVYEVTTE